MGIMRATKIDNVRQVSFVAGLGLEPRLTEPEPVVLPLDDPAMHSHCDTSETILENCVLFKYLKTPLLGSVFKY